MSGTVDRTCYLPGSCKLPLFIFSEELFLSFVRLCTVTRSSAPVHPISPFPFRPVLLLISRAFYAVSHISPHSYRVFQHPCSATAKKQSVLGPVLPFMLPLLVHGIKHGPMCMLPPKKLVSSEQVDARSQTYNGSILQGTPATAEYRAFLKCLFAIIESMCSLIPAPCITVSHQNTSCPVVFQNIRFFFSSKSNNTYQLLLKLPYQLLVTGSLQFLPLKV